MSLIPEDFQTPTWGRLMEFLSARREIHRDSLERADMDRPQNDAMRVAMLRGRLLELKELQALASKPAPADADRPLRRPDEPF